MRKAWVSIWVLLKGDAPGVLIAVVLTSLAVSSRLGNELRTTITSMFNPLPAIALPLMPMAPSWCGLGDASLIFVLIRAVGWPFSLCALLPG